MTCDLYLPSNRMVLKGLVKKYRGGGPEQLEMWQIKKHMTHPLTKDFFVI